MKEALSTKCPEITLDDSDCDSEYDRPTQAIAGRNIDPIKLKILLRTKFGAGSFEIQASLNFDQHIGPCNLASVQSSLKPHKSWNQCQGLGSRDGKTAFSPMSSIETCRHFFLENDQDHLLDLPLNFYTVCLRLARPAVVSMPTKDGEANQIAQIIRNSFCISAPRQLSNVSNHISFSAGSTKHGQCEIARCRRSSA